MLKIIFDKTLALILLILLAGLIVLLIILATIDTRQFGVFFQKRVGYQAKLFTIYKIRSLRTANHQHHMSKFGKFIRKFKLDELPQLYNVLIGDMSFVGPRPDIAGYADKLQGDDRIILTVKPGLTGPVQLKYRNEEQLLAEQENPQKYNDEVIWPDKVKINKAYVQNQSFWSDIGYMIKTIF
ncbi:sugar transferase [Vaginella massiliensis]|uniref:sugar transferase n=1 Tax=Vaginella massiliensis TaxID=1816680 RepID=UPI000838B92B|nr:sugar transferase [Vaginella massiliensis]